MSSPLYSIDGDNGEDDSGIEECCRGGCESIFNCSCRGEGDTVDECIDDARGEMER